MRRVSRAPARPRAKPNRRDEVRHGFRGGPAAVRVACCGMDTIETRLDALERSARRWRALAVGLLLCGAGAVGLAVGQSPARAQAPAPPNAARWQVVPLRDPNTNAAILVDSQTGDTFSAWGTPTEWRRMKR